MRLIIIRNTANNIKNIRKEFGRMTKISELIEYVPTKNVETVSYWSLMIWISSPLYIIIHSLLLDSHEQVDFSFNQLLLRMQWYTLLQQVGFVGLCVGILMFVKSFLLKNKNKIRFQEYIIDHLFPILLFLMLVWSMLSWYNSDNTILSFHGHDYRKEGLASYFAYAGIFSCGYIVRNNRYLQRILTFFTVTATFLSLLVLIDNDTINRLLTLHRNSAVFNNTNHFAYYLCLSAMCVVALILIEKRGKLALSLRLFCLAILTAALVKNNSFGPYIAMVMGFVFLFIMTFLFHKDSIKRLMLAAFIFLLVTVIMNIQTHFLMTEIQKLSGGVDNIVKRTENAGRAGSGRWRLWVNGVRFIAEKPIFGYGPDNLGARYLEAKITIDRPHNEIIQFAASLGIPAALLYIFAIGVHFRSLFIHRKNLTTIIIGLFAVVFAYLVSSMFGNTMYYTSPFFFMILGLSGGMVKSHLSCSLQKVYPC